MNSRRIGAGRSLLFSHWCWARKLQSATTTIPSLRQTLAGITTAPASSSQGIFALRKLQKTSVLSHLGVVPMAVLMNAALHGKRHVATTTDNQVSRAEYGRSYYRQHIPEMSSLHAFIRTFVSSSTTEKTNTEVTFNLVVVSSPLAHKTPSSMTQPSSLHAFIRTFDSSSTTEKTTNCCVSSRALLIHVPNAGIRPTVYSSFAVYSANSRSDFIKARFHIYLSLSQQPLLVHHLRCNLVSFVAVA